MNSAPRVGRWSVALVCVEIDSSLALILCRNGLFHTGLALVCLEMDSAPRVGRWSVALVCVEMDSSLALILCESIPV